MMKTILSWGLTALKTGAGAVGFSSGLIPTGWLIAGAVAAVMAVLAGTWKGGYDYRATLDEATALRIENAQIKAAHDEDMRQMDSVNKIQQADTDRAAALAKRNKELEGNATTVHIECDPDSGSVAPSRLLNIPTGSTVRPANGKRPANPARRRAVRGGPIVSPFTVDGGGSQPAVEPR